MAQKAVILCDNISSTAAQAAVAFGGGRGLLIVEATTYPSTCQLQIQSRSGKWVNFGSNISADIAMPLDLPQGQYRINLSGGTTSALYVVLASVAYQ